MANFHWRDIPEPVYKRLQQRARRTGRSVNKELLHIVEKDLGRPTPEELMARLREIPQRPFGSRPTRRAPRTLIREDRDTDRPSLLTQARSFAHSRAGEAAAGRLEDVAAVACGHSSPDLLYAEIVNALRRCVRVGGPHLGRRRRSSSG